MNTNDTQLPELTDARIDEIETQLFAAIRDGAADRENAAAAARRRRARRGRVWLAGGAAAAVLLAAAVIAPNLGGLGLGTAGGQYDAGAEPGVGPQPAPGAGEGFSADEDDGGIATEASGGVRDLDGGADSATGVREIIATASAAVRVEDVTSGAAQIRTIAEDAGGYVEALSLGANGEVYPQERYDSGLTVPYPQTNAWVSVRVPAAELDSVIAALSGVGEVTSSQLDRRDVTSEAVDLRARIEALRTSVQRLEALMADATSTADLLSAESALSERQAQLESYEQQLTYLEDQVSMSSLTVSLYEPGEPVRADPAGFGDGITAGWNGLVTTLNGIVVALGFLLPWLGVIAVIGAIAWLISRAVRGRRRRADRPGASPDEGDSPSEGGNFA